MFFNLQVQGMLLKEIHVYSVTNGDYLMRFLERIYRALLCHFFFIQKLKQTNKKTKNKQTNQREYKKIIIINPSVSTQKIPHKVPVEIVRNR